MNKLLPTKVKTNNTVTRIVEINTIKRDLVGRIVIFGKGVRQRVINYYELTQGIRNGVKRFLKEINIPVRIVVQKVEMVKGLYCTHITSITYQNTQNLLIMLRMGLRYVIPVIGNSTSINSDVIVQRYVDYTGDEKIKLNGKEIIWQRTK